MSWNRFLLQGQVDTTFTTFYLVVVLVLLAVSITVAVLVYRDAKQRGANAALWTAVWVILSLFGLFGWILFAIIYLLARPKQILYDRSGMPLMPPGSSPGWAQPPGYGGSPGYGQPPSDVAPPAGQQTPSARPPGTWGAPPAPPIPMMRPPATPVPRASKVKCPRCHTIFEFTPAVTGPTHLKCPACGEEGNI